MSKKPPDLVQRILINSLSAVLVAALIIFGEVPAFRWIFAAAIAAIAGVAVWEYDQLLEKKNLNPAVWLSVIATAVYVFTVFLNTQGYWDSAAEIVLGLAFLACFIQFALTLKSPIENIATTFLGIIYIAVPLSMFVRIMYFFIFGGGSFWIIYLIAVTKSADISGYFFGNYCGKYKLARRLSPNKTLEGALGGLITSILISLLLSFVMLENFSYIDALWLGALLGVFGPVGDLAESLLKRDAQVKDSNTIPGVGGILDMTDSLLFTAPIVYMYLRLVY